MEIAFRKEWNRNYLVMTGEEGKIMADYQMRMIQENRIPVFLPLLVRQVDSHLEAYYDMTGLQTLEQWMEHRLIRAEHLRGIFEALQQAEKATEDFLLEENRILLRTDCILIQPENRNVFFCFGFEAEGELIGGVRELMQRLLTKLDHGDQESIRIGYTLYQNCQQEPCTVTELAAICYSGKKAAAEVPESEEEWGGDTEVLTELPAYVPHHSYREPAQEYGRTVPRAFAEDVSVSPTEIQEREAKAQRRWTIWSVVTGAGALVFLILCLYTDIQERMSYPVRAVVTAVLAVNCVIGFWHICRLLRRS